MANVLCIYENKIATVALTEKFFRSLEKYDSRVNVKFLTVSKISNRDLSQCDILYIIRPNNAAFARIARLARSKAITVVFSLDDDLLNLPEDYADMPWRKTGLLKAAKNADIIVSSNLYICERYSRAANVSRIALVDTAVQSSSIKQHNNYKNERIKIVYAAGLSHKRLFDYFIKPIFKSLDDRYGDKISVTFIGVHPELNTDDYKMQVQFINSMPLNDYRALMESENFDIGLAPLITSEFTKCKYFNKFIEYAMFGIVGLYSNTQPYTFVVKDRINGILVNDSPEEWYKALSFAIENAGIVSKCRTNGYATLEKRFSPEIIMKKFIKDIPELISEHKIRRVKGGRLAVYKMGYFISRVGDWFYKIGFYLKKGGIVEVFNSIKRHIRVSNTLLF